MSKPNTSDVSSFSLETDDQTEEERAKAKQMKKGLKGKRPMDSNYLDDVVEPSSTIKFNLAFDRGIRNLKEDPAQQDSDRFNIKRLFEAVSSGEVSKMQGLDEYLHKNMKRLTDSQYKSNGKTALLKALLNLRQGENDTIEQLLDISEKMGDLKKFIDAAYTDSYYKGELPLSLAACTNQQDVVDFLMENPYQAVDVRQRDNHGNTVLHALVSVADNSPENTEFIIAMYDHILIKADQLHPKTKLEEIENNEGLTPITLAAKTGKLGLFKHIVQRELTGCRHLSRKITEWAYGPVCSSLYDLSSLDTYERNSALEIVVYGSEIPNRLEMLQIEPLNRLIEEKWDRFAHRMFLLNFIVYLIYLFIFTASAYHHEEGKDFENKTKPPYPYAKTKEGYLLLTGHIITITGAFYFFIRGLIDIVRKRPRFQSLIIDGYTDQLFLVQGLLFLTSVVLYCYGQYEYLAFLVLCLALSWINLLYFSRGSKNLGIYNVMIQKMVLGEIRRFLVVYLVFLIGFSAALVTLLDQESINSRSTRDFRLSEDLPSLDSTPDSSNHQSRVTHHQPTTARAGKGRIGLSADNEYELCKKPTYKNIYFTTLELFKFTIGMGDLEFTEHYKYKEVFYVLLIVYIVMTYILMLNMLIALMNQSVEMMSVESTSIWKLQRAITTLDMEWILPKCLQGKLRSGEEKDLGRGQEPDRRWCFSVEEVNWTQWNRNMGIINEDPGKCTQDTSPASVQREPSHGVLQTFSRRRRTQRTQAREAHELSPLAEASSSV